MSEAVPETPRRPEWREIVRLALFSLGVGVFRVAPELPAWTGRDSRFEYAGAFVGSPSFWLITLVAFVVGWIGLGAAARRGGQLRDAVRIALAGPALTLLAVAIDPVVHRTTATALFVIGCMLAVLAVAGRFRESIRVEATKFFEDDGYPDTVARARRRLRLCFVGLAIVCSAIAMLGPWGPLNGDEPHYFVLSRSLVQDFDLELGDDYRLERRPWFLPGDAPAHVVPGAAPGAVRSFHGHGLALLLTPVVAVAMLLPSGADLIWLRGLGSLWAVVLALALYRILVDYVGRPRALAGAGLTALTAPVLLQAPHLFPDLPAMALSALAWCLLASGGARARVAAGLALALLPWLHFKFLGLFLVQLAAGVWLLRRGRELSVRPVAVFAGVALVGPLSLSGLNWMLYGSASPLAAAAFKEVDGVRLTLLDHLADPLGGLRTGLGLLSDQKDGLLFYAPHYLLAIPGAVWLWRRSRAQLLWLLAIFGSLWLPAALSQNTGLWGPPARWLVGGLWPLALLAAFGAVASWSGRSLPVVRGVLLSLGFLATSAGVITGARFYVDRGDTISPLLAWLGGPSLPLWRVFPLWTRFDQSAWVATYWWTALGAIFAIWLAALAAADLGPRPHGRTSKPKGRSRRRGREWTRPFTDPLVAAGPGVLAAAATVVVVGALVLASVALVPADDPSITSVREYGPVRVESSRVRPLGGWLHSSSVWFPGARRGRVTLSVTAPLDGLELFVQTPVAMEARVRLGESRSSFYIEPGAIRRLFLQPERGTYWFGRWYYPLEVVSGEAVSAEGVFGAGDERMLGLAVSFPADGRGAPERPD